MDRNQIIGILLLFVLFYAWSVMNAPSEADIAAQKAQQDSIALVQEQMLDKTANELEQITEKANTEPVFESDSVKNQYLSQQYGPFGQAANGKAGTTVLENDDIILTFSHKGGYIKSAELKKYKKIIEDEKHKEIKVPLILMDDEKNIFEFSIPSNTGNGQLRTSDLYFSPSVNGNTIELSAKGANGSLISQTYTLSDSGYDIIYKLALDGTDNFVAKGENGVKLKWVNFLDKLEKNTTYEVLYSTVYFKELEEDPDYCSCRKGAVEEVNSAVKWVSHNNQFFNSSLIAENRFSSAVNETVMVDEGSDDLKQLRTELTLPLEGGRSEVFNMKWYIGPNDFESLRSYDLALEEVIPFGRSIFGSINRWVIRPVFNFLLKFISSKGLVILVLTLIVKIVLFPFMYKMLHSQSKMAALKPKLAGMREKFKDDSQKQQMESMKVYREYGVNPLGGCLPMVMQMPVWFALYRFFPASIEFRQASFLWATDLSSYDVFATLPFDIPFYGGHVSLFTILWAGTTLIYTYYNTKHMDMNSMNPAMKYMQYLMPVMFLFFFNNYASGLTLYLFYSNVLNIIQTVGSKKLLFNEDKMLKELENYKKKPKKKKSGIAEKFENAMKEQQRISAEREKSKKK